MNTAIEFDEFGRDLSLRNESSCYYSIFPEEYRGLSWFDICCLEDDKREIEALNEEIKKLKSQDMERKKLYEQGEYDIEEGEVFE